jgi:hypothetical protein
MFFSPLLHLASERKFVGEVFNLNFAISVNFFINIIFNVFGLSLKIGKEGVNNLFDVNSFIFWIEVRLNRNRIAV